MPRELDAPTLRLAMEAYGDELRRHRDSLDSMNVYPVPDGDTGTNMLLTQEAVVAALAGSDPDGVAAAISRASLMGARGNSGVILSQVLRAISDAVPSSGPPAGPEDFASALLRASEEADRAVAKPMDGTVLSVLRDAAKAAAAAGQTAGSVVAVVSMALEASRRSLAETKGILPELRAAGVVDAGAKGVVVLLDTLNATLLGQAPSEPIEAPGPLARPKAFASSGPESNAFEVQYLLEAGDEEIPALRGALSRVGDSVVVAGGDGLYNIHVHTFQPEEAVRAGDRAGTTRDVRIVGLANLRSACAGTDRV